MLEQLLFIGAIVLLGFFVFACTYEDPLESFDWKAIEKDYRDGMAYSTMYVIHKFHSEVELRQAINRRKTQGKFNAVRPQRPRPPR